MFTRQTLAVFTLLTIIFALPGCGYQLRGKVVQGSTSTIELVHEIDERLRQPGLANVETVVRRDPRSTSPTLAGRTRTNASGDFSISLSDFGAGWMHEEWLVQARQPGFNNASAQMKLPAKGSKWRVLITLAPGTATPLDTREEIMEDFERFR